MGLVATFGGLPRVHHYGSQGHLSSSSCLLGLILDLLIKGLFVPRSYRLRAAGCFISTRQICRILGLSLVTALKDTVVQWIIQPPAVLVPVSNVVKLI